MKILAKFPSVALGLASAMAIFVCIEPSAAQTTVNVNNGQTLTIANLLNGSFQGTNFTLGPTTTFEINQGGRIGNIGSTAAYGELNFLGSIIDINDGGIFGLCINPSCGVVKNLNLNVYDGGSAFMTLQAGSGTIANVYGGSISNTILEAGSKLNFLGGSMGRSLVRARSGSSLNISGGRFRNFDVQPGSDVTLVGGDFRLNGAEYTSPTVSLVYGDVFSGVLSDGSVFIVDPFSNTSYSNIKLDRVPLPEITTYDFVIDGNQASVPQNLRSGQSLKLLASGQLDNLFFAQGATIELQGGSVGYEASVVESNVKISGGTIGDRFTASTNSTVEITGGQLEYSAWARAESTWSIRGGSVGELRAFDGSEVNISGGRIRNYVQIEEGSVLNIRGGIINGILAFGGTVNLFVTAASINSSPIELESGTPQEVSERDFGADLNVILADGTPLSMSLAPDYSKTPSPFVHPEANLILTLVPEPSSVGLWLLTFVWVWCSGRRRT